MFKMKSNTNEPNNIKSESTYSFNNVSQVLSNNGTSVDIMSPYIYRKLGIFGHRIHPFRNSDLKTTPESTDVTFDLNRSYFNDLFSRSFKRIDGNVFVHKNSLPSKSNLKTELELGESIEKPQKKKALKVLEDEHLSHMRPSSLNDLSERLRKIYAASLESNLNGSKSVLPSRMTPQTKIVYNLSKIHMQNKLQLLSRLSNRNSSMY